MPESSRKTRNIVVFGGGTGMSNLLRGLKKYDINLKSIVAMSDDGGSSGRLRHDMDLLPPGDVRNCLIALADSGPLMQDLMQYRFSESDLSGHSFGNLFLAVLTKVCGDFRSAVDAAHEILNVKGRVIPSVLKKVSLEAEHYDGTKTLGQADISISTKKIKKIRLLPKVDADEEVLKAIREADILVYGPGSLFTSVLPNFLPLGVLDEILKSKAYKIYVCNTMTQPGETQRFSLEDHLRAFDDLFPKRIIDTVIVNDGIIREDLLKLYSSQSSDPVYCAENSSYLDSYDIKKADLLCKGEAIRHDPDKLARFIMDTVTYVS